MGCSSAKEKIESKMLLLKLQRIQIKEEKMKKCTEYKKKTGISIERKPIPDFIDFAALESSKDNEAGVKKKQQKKTDDDDNEDEDEVSEEQDEEEDAEDEGEEKENDEEEEEEEEDNEEEEEEEDEKEES